MDSSKFAHVTLILRDITRNAEIVVDDLEDITPSPEHARSAAASLARLFDRLASLCGVDPLPTDFTAQDHAPQVLYVTILGAVHHLLRNAVAGLPVYDEVLLAYRHGRGAIAGLEKRLRATP
jgi:hypothetical protein